LHPPAATPQRLVARLYGPRGYGLHALSPIPLSRLAAHLNATFRASLAGLVRRGRALLHQEGRLRAGLYLVGCAYNFCWEHASLRVAAPEGSGKKWQGQTPAMAAGLTDHRWGLHELLATRLPPARWQAPRKRRRRRRRRRQPPTSAAPAAA
jgi:hypothetical protein